MDSGCPRANARAWSHDDVVIETRFLAAGHCGMGISTTGLVHGRLSHGAACGSDVEGRTYGRLSNVIFMR